MAELSLPTPSAIERRFTMLSLYNDWDRSLAELRRQMSQLLDDFDSDWPSPSLFGSGKTWPRMNLADAGEKVVLTAEVPGLSEKDVNVAIEQDVLTISGERQVKVPEGYSIHRQERGDFKFVRSLAMPCKVDAEKATASVRNGVLTVSLPKAPEAQPKRIEVRTS
jgi:HSP20 family protein